MALASGGLFSPPPINFYLGTGFFINIGLFYAIYRQNNMEYYFASIHLHLLGSREL